MSSPITSVSATSGPLFSQSLSAINPEPDALISLAVRGTTFELAREELTSLPESVLLCLFPNGLMLEDHIDSSIPVDFDPETLAFVLNFFRKALAEPQSTPLSNIALVHGKVAIIVLKEDLDFYVIPPKGTPGTTVIDLRRRAGEHLVTNTSVFDGLRKQGAANGAGGASSSAEQHLIDMLCASGFGDEENWSKRYVEPQKTYSISNNHEPEIAPVLAEACAQMLVGLDAVAAAIGRPGSQGLGQESLDIRIEHYWVIEHQAFKRLGISAAFVMLFHAP